MRVRKLRDGLENRVLRGRRCKGLWGFAALVVCAVMVVSAVQLTKAVTIDIAPDTLNLASGGNWVSAYVEPTVLLSDNFDDGDCLGWTVLSGTWGMAADMGNWVYSGTATGDEQVTYALSTGTYEDVVFEAKVKAVNNAGHYGIVVREDGSGNHYGFYLNAYNNGAASSEGLYYFGYWNGAYDTIVAWTSAGGAYTDANLWNTMKIVASGCTFELYINGILVNTVTDPHSHALSGHVGLIIDQYESKGQNCYFDDIRVVENFDVSTVDVSTVKLWHIWADDFSDPIWTGANWQKLSTALWTVEGGEYQGTGSVSTRDISLAGAMLSPIEESDVTMNVKVRNDAFGALDQGAIIPIRYKDGTHMAALVFFPTSVRLQMVTGGSWTCFPSLEGVPMDIGYTQHDVRIVAEGADYEVYVDDMETPKITATFASADLGKRLGVWAYGGGGSAFFDDFSVLRYITSAVQDPTSVGDYDCDGVPDLMVKFDRAALATYLTAHGLTTGYVDLVVTGNANDGSAFSGADSLRVISKGKVKL